MIYVICKIGDNSLEPFDTEIIAASDDKVRTESYCAHLNFCNKDEYTLYTIVKCDRIPESPHNSMVE